MKVYNANDLWKLLPAESEMTTWMPIPGDGEANADVMIVLKAPTVWDVSHRKPLLGPPGLTVRKALLAKGLSTYVTHCVPFFKDKDAKVTKSHIDECKHILNKEIEKINPSKVLLMGADAARTVDLFQVPFKKYNEVLGRNHESNGILFRATETPGQIAFDPGKYALFLEALDDIKDSKLIKPNPHYKEMYTVTKDREEAEAILSKLPKRFAFDIESTGLDIQTDKVLTMSFSWRAGQGITVPWTLFSPLEWEDMLRDKEIIAQNGQFDLKMLYANGINKRALKLHADTMLMHSLIDETSGTHSMEAMAHRYLNIDKWGDTVDYEQFKYGLTGMRNPKGVDKSQTPTQSFEVVGNYAARDVDITWQLYKIFEPEVERKHINSVIHRAQNALINQEQMGILIDRPLAFKMQSEILEHLESKRTYLHESFGLENPNSPQQVASFLYESIGVPVQKRKGVITTDNRLLEPFAKDFPVILDILEYKRLVRAEGTYIRRILEASQKTGRYHPQFKLAGTETGRVTEPLIALLPRSEEVEGMDLGKQYQSRLRSLFIADEGCTLIGADYSALEVRMAAYLSGDEQLIIDINNDVDIHSVNAIQAFDLDVELEPYATLKKRTNEKYAYYRSLAKIATFASMYGGSASAIAHQTGIDVEVAQAIIGQLYRRYPKLKVWQDRTIQAARVRGFISTPWGRRRHFMFGQGMEPKVEQAQEREAINFPFQGHSSDMNLSAFAEATERGLWTLFPFHDAIYAQATDIYLEQDKELLKEIMQTQIQGQIVFEAEVKSGQNWADI